MDCSTELFVPELREASLISERPGRRQTRLSCGSRLISRPCVSAWRGESVVVPTAGAPLVDSATLSACSRRTIGTMRCATTELLLTSPYPALLLSHGPLQCEIAGCPASTHARRARETGTSPPDPLRPAYTLVEKAPPDSRFDSRSPLCAPLFGRGCCVRPLVVRRTAVEMSRCSRLLLARIPAWSLRMGSFRRARDLLLRAVSVHGVFGLLSCACRVSLSAKPPSTRGRVPAGTFHVCVVTDACSFPVVRAEAATVTRVYAQPALVRSSGRFGPLRPGRPARSSRCAGPCPLRACAPRGLRVDLAHGCCRWFRVWRLRVSRCVAALPARAPWLIWLPAATES